MVEDGILASRLDQIETRWSLVRRGALDATAVVADARRVLVLRYSSAIRRYAGSILKDDDAADELAQDVVMRLLRGDFGNADPDRGRFRDLLKTTIRNMARNHWAKMNRRRGESADIEQLADHEPLDDRWTEAWRQNLLDLTWSALQEYERSHSGSIAYTVLRLRTDHPDVDSQQFAERLSEKTGRAIRADTARQQLHRARRRFAELLVKEVADGLDLPSAQRIQDELIAVGLYEHVREFVESSAEN